MPLDISIPDANLAGLSQPAQQEVKATVERFANDLISEANRLEAHGRSAAALPDVSAQMVRDAASLVRRGMQTKPTSLKSRLGRVAAAALALLVGVIWDKDSLSNSQYLVFFGVVLAAALVTTTLVAFKD